MGILDVHFCKLVHAYRYGIFEYIVMINYEINKITKIPYLINHRKKPIPTQVTI